MASKLPIQTSACISVDVDKPQDTDGGRKRKEMATKEFFHHCSVQPSRRISDDYANNSSSTKFMVTLQRCLEKCCLAIFDLIDQHRSIPWIWRETSMEIKEKTKGQNGKRFLCNRLCCHQQPLFKLRTNVNSHFFSPVGKVTLFLINTCHFITRMPG